MAGSSYEPDESSFDLWMERFTFAGGILGGVCYGKLLVVLRMACRFANRVVTGFHACIFFAAAYLIRRTGATKTQKMKQGAVLLVLFTLGTIHISCNSEFFEMMFVDDRDFPGGPTAWLLAKYSIAVNAIGTTAFVIADIVTSTIVVSVVLF